MKPDRALPGCSTGRRCAPSIPFPARIRIQPFARPASGRTRRTAARSGARDREGGPECDNQRAASLVAQAAEPVRTGNPGHGSPHVRRRTDTAAHRDWSLRRARGRGRSADPRDRHSNGAGRSPYRHTRLDSAGRDGGYNLRNCSRVCAASVLTDLLSAYVFGVQKNDPLTFAAAMLLLVCVAIGACSLPASRAAQIDPIMALRQE